MEQRILDPASERNPVRETHTFVERAHGKSRMFNLTIGVKSVKMAGAG